MVFTLFKIRLKSVINGLLSGSKKKAVSGGRKVLFGILLIYVLVVFLGLSAAICALMCRAFYSIGYGWLYFAMVSIFAFLLCFIGSVLATGSQLYNSKDNQMLLAMPVKPGDILASRMLVLLLENYLYAGVILIPAGVVWCIFCPVTVMGAVLYIVSSLLLPFLSLTLSCLLGWVIAAVSSRMRRKGIISAVIYIAFFVVYLKFCANITNYINDLVANGEVIAAAVRKALFPMYHFGIAAAEGNLLSFLFFALCAVVPFAIVYFVLSRNFISIATANRGTAKVKYKERAAKASDSSLALLKKEIRHYMANPMYIMNASIGAVLMVVLAGYLLIKNGDLAAIAGAVPGMEGIIPGIVCAGLCMCAAMVIVSAPSVSIEGPNLWLIKSLPVETHDVLMAKVNCHIVVTEPFVILSAALASIALKTNVLETVLMFLLPTMFVVFGALFGVVINLKFPKFDWISEVHCIKQSAASMITMFGMMALVIVEAVLYFLVLSSFLSLDIYLAAVAVVMAAGALGMYAWLKSGGCRAFDAL